MDHALGQLRPFSAAELKMDQALGQQQPFSASEGNDISAET